MNMPLYAVAGDFKVHRSAFTGGLQIEAENMMVACRQTSQTSGGYWTEMRRSSSLLLLTFLSLQHL